MEKAYTAQEALDKLKEGNARFLREETARGDISRARRLKTYEAGEHPYAVVVSCADARVVPEYIFSAGIGELYVLRVAGNIIEHALIGSIERACAALQVPLVVVMGHTGCGVIASAMRGAGDGYIKYLTYPVDKAVKSLSEGITPDLNEACRLNVKLGVHTVRESIPGWASHPATLPTVIGAVYQTDTGIVDFI